MLLDGLSIRYSTRLLSKNFLDNESNRVATDAVLIWAANLYWNIQLTIITMTFKYSVDYHFADRLRQTNHQASRMYSLIRHRASGIICSNPIAVCSIALYVYFGCWQVATHNKDVSRWQDDLAKKKKWQDEKSTDVDFGSNRPPSRITLISTWSSFSFFWWTVR